VRGERAGVSFFPVMNLSGHIQRALLRRIVSLPAPLVRAIAGPRVVSPDGCVLEVDAQLLLRVSKAAGHRESSELGVVGAREEMDRAMPIVDFHGVPSRVSDRAIPGPRGDIPIRIYHPRSQRLPRPVLVYFHGGGFVVGSIASYDGVCRMLAREADAIVVSVGYRLAPEHRFPAGIEDGIAATRWVIAEAASFGGNPHAVAVGGDSAGGTSPPSSRSPRGATPCARCFSSSSTRPWTSPARCPRTAFSARGTCSPSRASPGTSRTT
jgi:acetyl esterase